VRSGVTPATACTLLIKGAEPILESDPERAADMLVLATWAALAANRRDAMLFKDLATLRVERSLLPHVESLRWAGPTPAFAEVCERIDARPLAARAARLAKNR